MNDEDIAKLANKLTQSLATKDDIKQLRLELKEDIKELDQKADTILSFVDGIEETVESLSW